MVLLRNQRCFLWPFSNKKVLSTAPCNQTEDEDSKNIITDSNENINEYLCYLKARETLNEEAWLQFKRP